MKRIPIPSYFKRNELLPLNSLIYHRRESGKEYYIWIICVGDCIEGYFFTVGRYPGANWGGSCSFQGREKGIDKLDFERIMCCRTDDNRRIMDLIIGWDQKFLWEVIKKITKDRTLLPPPRLSLR